MTDPLLTTTHGTRIVDLPSGLPTGLDADVGPRRWVFRAILGPLRVRDSEGRDLGTIPLGESAAFELVADETETRRLSREAGRELIVRRWRKAER